MIFDHQHLLPGFRWCVRQRLFGSPGRQGRVFVPETHRQADAYTGALAGFAFEVDLAALGESLVWEPSRGGALFPHIYGPLPVSAVTARRTMSVAADGVMTLGPVLP